MTNRAVRPSRYLVCTRSAPGNYSAHDRKDWSQQRLQIRAAVPRHNLGQYARVAASRGSSTRGGRARRTRSSNPGPHCRPGNTAHDHLRRLTGALDSRHRLRCESQHLPVGRVSRDPHDGKDRVRRRRHFVALRSCRLRAARPRRRPHRNCVGRQPVHRRCHHGTRHRRHLMAMGLRRCRGGHHLLLGILASAPAR